MRSFVSLLFGAAIAAVTIAPASAAQSDPITYYVGADYQYVSPSWKSPYDLVLSKNLETGMDFHFGVRWTRYFGAELGYMASNGDRDLIVAGTDVSTKTKIGGPKLDFMGYLPFGNSGVSGIGTVGVSDLRGEAKIETIAGDVSAHKSEIGYRGGVGLEWRPYYHFGVRALVRYQSADFDDVAKHAIVGSVGFNFYF